MKTEKLLKRFKDAESLKSNWRNRYEETLRYTFPDREKFTERSPGEETKNGVQICDSTAINAVNKFVSNLQSSLVPPMRRWTKLTPGNSIPEENRDEAKKILESITHIMFDSIANSNFDTQISECFCDLAIGTGAMLVLKGESATTPLRFVTVPLHELFLEQGPLGRVDTVFRRHQVHGRNIKATWEDAKIPEAMQSKIDNEPNYQHTLIECTYPKKINIKVQEADDMGKVVLVNREVDGFNYVVIDEKSKSVLVDRDQESSPWIVFRWTVAPGEVYGRGPAMAALHDIKSLNKSKELWLKRASLDVAPPIMVQEDGFLDVENIDVQPMSVIPVQYNAGGMNAPSIQPLVTGGSINLAQICINDLITSINETLFANPLGKIDAPVKTATEISYRQQELSKRIGSAFGRLQYELITPLINRIIYVLNEWDIFDRFDGVDDLKVDGRFISVKHESPLASAQDQESLMAMQQFVEILAQTFGPEAIPGLMNPDKFIEIVGKFLNVPNDVMLNQEQVEAIKQKLAQAGQAAEQMQANEANGIPPNQ